MRTLENLKFDKIGDKALSIGENSILRGKNLIIKDSRIAVASKDLSEAKINTIKIENSKFGLAVFQKKTDYGKSFLEIKNLDMEEMVVWMVFIVMAKLKE